MLGTWVKLQRNYNFYCKSSGAYFTAAVCIQMYRLPKLDMPELVSNLCYIRKVNMTLVGKLNSEQSVNIAGTLKKMKCELVAR